MFARITPVVKYLLIINAAVYFLGSLMRIDLGALFALYNVSSDYFMPFQYVTYMFLHADGFHLFSNMFGLFMFGPLLEGFWGPKRFLIFYMVTGLGAGILYSGINYFEFRKVNNAADEYIATPNPDHFNYFITKHADRYYEGLYEFIDKYSRNADQEVYIRESKEIVRTIVLRMQNGRMVGASGAIFGILLAFGMLFPNTVLMLLFPPIPIKAKYFVLFYGLFELYGIIKQAPDDNVAHYAHLAGMLVAYIMIKIWQNNRTSFY